MSVDGLRHHTATYLKRILTWMPKTFSIRIMKVSDKKMPRATFQLGRLIGGVDMLNNEWKGS